MKTSLKTLGFLLLSVPVLFTASTANADVPPAASAEGDAPTAPAAPDVTTTPPSPTPAPQNPLPNAVLTGNMVPRERVITWDLNVDAAYGRLFSEPDARWTAFGRVRAGVMYIHDSLYFSLGPTYEISKLQPATFGLQGEVMHIETGLWCQIGALVDIAPHPGFMVAAGWSLFGIEFQAREYDTYGIGEAPAVYGKIRIPIGVIARAFK